MGAENSKENVSMLLKTASISIATSSETIKPRQRFAQNFVLTWVDATIDESTPDCQNMLVQLQRIANDVNTFTEPDRCIQFLNGLRNEKVFIITSGSLGQRIVPEIHDMPQLDSIYVFCGDKSRHEGWSKQWIKIKDLYTNITVICQALQQATNQCNQDSVTMSFVTVNEGASNHNRNPLEASFMYIKILKEIFFRMKDNEKSTQDLAIYCRKFYNYNPGELALIDEFERDYQSKSAIWWYTRRCFIYQMLSRALRMLEGDTIIIIAFFIRDLDKQILELYKKQVDSYRGKPLTVYRGQGLLKADFKYLVKMKDGLMSFNDLIFASTKREVSLGYTETALTKTSMVGVVFKIFIDPSIASAPFASIREVSYTQTEEDILFPVHTVFRIGDINKIDNNDSLYQVDLKLLPDDDEQLCALTERIQREVGGETGWQQLGQLLIKSEQFDKAEKMYTVLIEHHTSEDDQKADYYNQLGSIKNSCGNYVKAIEYYEKAFEIRQKILPPDHLDFVTFHQNIGSVYNSMGDYSKALSFYEQALEIQEKTLPPDHPDLATSYNNIGCIHKNMKVSKKALPLHEKALEIQRKSLPPDHLDFATTYKHIGNAYDKMGRSSKALAVYEKALAIQEKTLSPDHPDVATSHSNIGTMYKHIGEYAKALVLQEKALEIRRRVLPSDNLDLAASYKNVGSMYDNMGKYQKALSFYEKGLEIQKKVLPPYHSDLAASYNDLGSVSEKLGDYQKSLVYFERALDAKQRTLPAKHPDILGGRKSIELIKRKL